MTAVTRKALRLGGSGPSRQCHGGGSTPCMLVAAQTAPMIPTTAEAVGSQERKVCHTVFGPVGGSRATGTKRKRQVDSHVSKASNGAPIEAKKPPQQMQTTQLVRQIFRVVSGTKRRRRSMVLAAVRTMMLVWFLRSLGFSRVSSAFSRIARNGSPL